MPCTYTGSFEGDAAHFAREALDATTALLCELCRHSEENGFTLTPAAAVWWEKHKAADAARKTP